MKNNLVERVLKTIRNFEMTAPGDIVLAAVSGGPDSVFLLHCLAALKSKLKLRSIAVCNLDHGLRGAESRADSLFVKKLASSLGMKFVHKKTDIKKLCGGKLSVEEAARLARYGFFKVAAEKTGAGIIATGHTLDDQAETVLMRIIKGSSLKGMAGISPVRREGMYKVIRPLIELEKAEICGYLDDAGIRYRTDRTNAEPIYFRNVVRKRVVPFLEEFNPRIKKALANMAEHLREDFEYIALEKERLRDKIMRKEGSRVVLMLKDIIVQPKALQKEILRDALEASGGEVKRLSFRHWKELESLIRAGRNGNCVDLPGGIRAARSENKLSFKHKAAV